MFDNDEPTDDWFDRIGLGDLTNPDEAPANEFFSTSHDSAGRTPPAEVGRKDLSRNENTEGVATAIHGAVALLQSLHADEPSVPGAVASWAAVYGTATVEPDLDELQREFRERRPRTIPDAFMAGAVAMGDAISAPTSDLVSQQLAAHVRIETELLKRLAEVTDRPMRDVLAYLEEWATIETAEPR